MKEELQSVSELYKTVVSGINTRLEGNWSEKQLKKGMFFEIKEEWRPFYKLLVKKYRDVGWVINTNVELTPGIRKVFMNVMHPTTSMRG